METQIRGEKAFELHEKVRKNEELRRQILFDSMEALYEIRKNKYYQTILGDEKAPWKAYLGQHDTYYTSSQVYTFDKIYRKFRVELGLHPKEISEIPVTKLSNLVTIVNIDNVREWITKAKELTTQDFQDELRKAHGKVSYLECPHDNKVSYEVCENCSFRHKK